MAYDIPPPLQHKEKILFGLTFQQLGYAAPAFLLLVIIVLKIKMSIYVSGTIGVLIALVAVFFMFFDGKERLLHLITFLRNKEVQVNSDKLKDIINIEKVENSIVATKKGKLSILEVIPMNLMIRPDEEKESIIAGFQKFLNSLDFSIQFHVSSHPISVRMHLKDLEIKMKDKKELFASYCTFLKGTIEHNNIKNRRFYVIIQEKYDLAIQTQVCKEKLESLGLKVRTLAGDNLLKMFYEYIADNQQKKLQDDQEIEEYMHFLLSPQKVVFYPDYFEIGKKYCEVIAVTGYPHTVEIGFLDKIISSGENYDVSIHIEPFPINDTMIQLNRELQKQQADLYSDSKKGILNPSLDIKFASTRKVLEDLQKGKQKLFHVSLYIMCKGSNKAEVDVLAKKVKADLDGLMIQNSQPTFQMMDAYASMLPLAKNPLNVKQNIHTQGLSAFFPFSSPFLDIEHDGILLGLNKNKIPYIKNLFGLTNANGIVLATSGAGKSYFTKLLMSRMFMNDCDVIIIDPQGEYLGITEHYKGETITISKDSNTMINPLDLMGHEYLEKRLSLMDIFQIMFGDLTEVQKSILDKAIDLTYGRKGINGKKINPNSAPPKMQDLYQEMKNLEHKCASQERVTYRALLNRLRMYTEGGVFSFLDKETNINFSNNFVCFNIGNMPKQVKPVVMYLVLDFVYMRMKKSLKRKLLVIDEAWSMLQTAEESSYIFEIVKTCRKYNLGLLMITQDVADLVGSRAGHAVLANTSYTFLLRQKPAVIDNVKRTFNLSAAEREYLMCAEKGNGILILENEHQELHVIASEEEHNLVTTNPDEMRKKTEKKEGVVVEKEKIDVTLDIEKDVHAAWDKSIEEGNFLSNNGYVLGSFHNLTKGKHKEYFVKKRAPEGAQHTFYVDIIYQELKKYTENVSKYRTERPDIVFVNAAGEEIAIEVETGVKAKYESHKDYFNDKFAKRVQEYGDRCYIFLTAMKYRNSYARHKMILLFRLQIKEFASLQFSSKQNTTIGTHFKDAE